MHTEAEVVGPILSVLRRAPKGILSTTEIRAEVKKLLPLTAYDLEPLRNRPDTRIDQVIRNVKCHKNVPGNPFFEGYFEEVPRGFKLTAKGRRIS